MNEEISIGTPINIFKREKIKNKNYYSIVTGKITEKLFEAIIEQCSINTKTKTGKNKYTGKSQTYTSKEHEQWEQMNVPIIKSALNQKGLTCDSNGYFALLLLTHPHYNQDGKSICGIIKDVHNMIKNLPDLLERIVYENDKQVMISIPLYSKKITPHEMGYRYRRDDKLKREVQKKTEIKYLTLKVYKVEEIINAK